MRSVTLEGKPETVMKTLLQELIAWVQTQPEVVALYLYGSRAQGQANALSDVDVAILARQDLSREELWRLEERCAVRWPETLDIRVLNIAPLAFRYEVTARGRRLWADNSGMVADWESLTWRLYWDLYPRLQRDWQHYVRQVMEHKDETERQQYQAALANVRAVHRRVREAASGYATPVSGLCVTGRDSRGRISIG